MITHSVGLSIGPTSSIESGIAVREIFSGKLIYLDKLFSMNDVTLFFENYPLGYGPEAFPVFYQKNVITILNS